MPRGGSYEDYKYHTHLAISWVLETAKDRGWSPTNDFNPALPKGPRLKGKARAAQKKDRLNAKSSHNTTPHSLDRVTTRDILKAAEHLAADCLAAEANLEKIVVHRNVVNSLHRAIGTRKAYAARYAAEEIKNEKSNPGHFYFIGVLEELWKILRPCVKVQIAVPTKGSGDTSNKNDVSVLGNLFAALNVSVEEIAVKEAVDEPQQLSEVSEFKPAQKWNFEMTLEEREQEFLLQWNCLVNDIKERLEYLEARWQEYFAGASHLITVMFLTEAIIELTAQQEEELIEKSKGEGLALPVQAKAKTGFTNSSTYTTLRDVSKSRTPADECLIRLQPLDKRYDTEDRLLIDQDQFLVQIFMELLFESEMVKCEEADRINGTWLDQISKILGQVSSGEQILLTTVFAADTLLSIQSIPGFSTAKAQKQLLKAQDQLCHMKNDFSQHRDLVLGSGTGANLDRLQDWIQNWPMRSVFSKYRYFRLLPTQHPLCGHHGKFMADLDIPAEDKDEPRRQYAETGLQDLTGDAKSRQEYYDQYIMPSSKHDFLERGSPMFCGKIHLALLLAQEEVQLQLASESPDIGCMAYIYVTAQQRGILKHGWPSLEQAIAMHSKTLFGAEQPQGPEKVMHRFLITTGVPATLITGAMRLKEAKGRPSSDLVRSMKNFRVTKRNWKFQSSAATELLRSYSKGQETLRRTVYHLDKDIQKSQSLKPQPVLPLDESGAILYLDALKDHLDPVETRLEFAYAPLLVKCSTFFQTLDAKFSEIITDREPAQAESWRRSSRLPYDMTFEILHELYQANLAEAEGSSSKTSESLPTPKADAALQLLKSFL